MQENKKSSASTAKGTVSKPESKEASIVDVFKGHKCDEFYACEWSMLCDQGENCCCERQSTR